MDNVKEVNAALVIFEEAAVGHTHATEQGDYKLGNECYDRLTKAVAFLKKVNSINLLGKLLDNGSVGVRLWAASYLLPINEEKAIKVLEEIVNTRGIHSLIAETTIAEWRKGNLHSMQE